MRSYELVRSESRALTACQTAKSRSELTGHYLFYRVNHVTSEYVSVTGKQTTAQNRPPPTCHLDGKY